MKSSPCLAFATLFLHNGEFSHLAQTSHKPFVRLNRSHLLYACSCGINQGHICFKNNKFLMIGTLGKVGGVILGVPGYPHS